jgi:hypothetical protein
MKVRSYCRDCLKNLAGQVVMLSHGGQELLDACLDLIDTQFAFSKSPTDISNRLLKYVKQETGAYDPYRGKKSTEFYGAIEAAERLKGFFPENIEGALQSSAFGNGGDFFTNHLYDTHDFRFRGDVAKITEGFYISNDILILGDNPGDFVFDMPLVRLLQKGGKRVLYAVKEHPVQNDLSMPDVVRFGLHEMHPDVLSTGTAEVGIRREEMSGIIREFWENGNLIVAKGMGNYESLSEYDDERRKAIVYIMKVKCNSVAEDLQRNLGDHTAFIGGEHG